MTSARLHGALLVLASVCAGSCDDNGGGTPMRRPDDVITSPGGAVMLFLPPGALPSNVSASDVRLVEVPGAELPKDADGDTALAAVRLEPAGLRLQGRVRLSFTVHGSATVPLLVFDGAEASGSRTDVEIFASEDAIRLSADVDGFTGAVVVPGLFYVDLFPDGDHAIGHWVLIGADVTTTGKSTVQIGAAQYQVEAIPPDKGVFWINGAAGPSTGFRCTSPGAFSVGYRVKLLWYAQGRGSGADPVRRPHHAEVWARRELRCVPCPPTSTAAACAVPTPPLAISPAPVDFGKVRVGATGTASATVTFHRSSDAREITMVEVRTNSPDFPPKEFTVSKNGCGDTFRRSGSCTVELVYRPTRVGANKGFLVVVGQGGVLFRADAHIDLFGEGVEDGTNAGTPDGGPPEVVDAGESDPGADAMWD